MAQELREIIKILQCLKLRFFARPIDDEVNTLEMTAGNAFN